MAVVIVFLAIGIVQYQSQSGLFKIKLATTNEIVKSFDKDTEEITKPFGSLNKNKIGQPISLELERKIEIYKLKYENNPKLNEREDAISGGLLRAISLFGKKRNDQPATAETVRNYGEIIEILNGLHDMGFQTIEVD